MVGGEGIYVEEKSFFLHVNLFFFFSFFQWRNGGVLVHSLAGPEPVFYPLISIISVGFFSSSFCFGYTPWLQSFVSGIPASTSFSSVDSTWTLVSVTILMPLPLVLDMMMESCDPVRVGLSSSLIVLLYWGSNM